MIRDNHDGGINEASNSLFAMNSNKNSKRHHLLQSIRLLGITYKYSFISSSGDNSQMLLQSVENQSRTPPVLRSQMHFFRMNYHLEP